MLDREISYFNMYLKQLAKCLFALKLILYSTVSNLFPLEIVQICGRCELCVLRENSIEAVY